MSLELLIQKYGYLAVLIGTVLEGETIVIIAGFAAYRGYLNLPLVCTVAFAGTFFGDQMAFFIGRFKGKTILAKHPSWQARFAMVSSFMDRHQNWIVPGFRFIYGMRSTLPFAIGLSNVKTSRFVVLNFLSGVVWAIVFGTGGYLFGTALETLFGDIKHVEKYIFLGILIVGLVLWIYHLHRKRYRLRMKNSFTEN
jgi:membrane protein DedA with SNARE-associated domain